jgi:hypothetical protein
MRQSIDGQNSITLGMVNGGGKVDTGEDVDQGDKFIDLHRWSLWPSPSASCISSESSLSRSAFGTR